MLRVTIQISLGILLVLAASIALIYYGFNEENRMVEYEFGVDARAIEVGADLFENNCSGCHGLTGEGIPGLCPPLNDGYFFTERLEEVGWNGTLEDYIVSTVASGRLESTRPEYVGGGSPAMPAWSDQFGGPLRDDQIRDIARFVINWEATAIGVYEPEEVTEPEVDDPLVRGAAVYTQSGCGGCHVLGDLSSGVVGPQLTKIGEVGTIRIDGYTAEEYILESILDPNAYIVEGYDPDIMPKTFGETITSTALDDLVLFLANQK
jgi:mono/diheme cytochrome c family protein